MPAPALVLLAACLTLGTGCEDELASFPIGDLNLSFTLIEQWRIPNFSTIDDAGPAGDTADPDGDGRPNLLEYALGTNPTVATSQSDPVVTIAGGRLVLTFDRVADPTLTYSVEATDSLTTPTWSVIWSSTGSGNSDGSVSVKDIVPIAGQSTRFLRLKVSH